MPTWLPTRTSTKKEKAEIEAHPVTAKKKKKYFMCYCFTSTIN